MQEPVFSNRAITGSEKNILDVLATSISRGFDCVPLNSCKFFGSVVLQDFPPEILLQHPTILEALLELCNQCANDANLNVNSHLLLKAALEGLTKYSTLLLQSLLNLQDAYYVQELTVIQLEEESEPSESAFPRVQALSLPQYLKAALKTILSLFEAQICGPDAAQLLLTLSELFKCCPTSFSCPEQTQFCQKLSQIFRQLRKHPSDYASARRNYISLFLLVPAFLDPWLLGLQPTVDILPSALLHEFFIALLDKGLVVNFPSLQPILAHYLQSSHYHLHQNYQEALNLASGVRQGALLVSQTFQDVPSLVECFRIARVALPIDVSVCEAILTALLKKICLFAGHGLRNEELVQSEELGLNLIRDKTIRNMVYNILRAIFAKYLGISAATEFSNPEDLNFLLSSKILQELALHGLDDPDSEVRTTVAKIWTLLLKGQKFLKEYQWQFLTEEIPEILPFLQASGSTQRHLLAVLWALHDSPVFEPITKYCFVVRELFQREPALKLEAIAPFIASLAQQVGSHRLLPKFSQIDSNSIQEAFQLPAPVSLASRKNITAIHELSSLQNVLSRLKNCERSEVKSHLLQINILLEDSSLGRHVEAEGLELLKKLTVRALTSEVSCTDWLPPLISSFLNAILASEVIRKKLSEDLNFLQNLTRAVIWGYIDKDALLHRDALVLLSLLVYNGIVLIDDKCGIHVEKLLQNNTSFPFLTEIIDDEASEGLEQPTRVTINLTEPHYIQFWKIVWHLAQNCKKSKNNYQPKIFELSGQDVLMLQVTSPLWSLEQALGTIIEAGDHEQVLNQLEVIQDYLRLFKYGLDKRDGAESWLEMAALPWVAAFQKFVASQPSSRKDEILFSSLVDTLSLLVGLLKETPDSNKNATMKWINELLQAEEGVMAMVLKEQCAKAALPEGNVKENVPEAFNSISSLIKEMAFKCEGQLELLHWDHLKKILAQGLHDCHHTKFYKLASLNLTLETLVCAIFAQGPLPDDVSVSWEELYEDLCHILYSFGRQTATEGYMGRGIIQSASLLLSRVLWAWSGWTQDPDFPNKLRLQQDLVTSSHLQTRWAILQGWLYATRTVDLLKVFCEASESEVLTNLFRMVLSKEENYLVRALAAKILGNVTEKFSPVLPTEDVKKILREFLRFGNRKDLNSNSVAQLFEALAHLVFNMLDSPYGEAANGAEEKVDFLPVFPVARSCLMSKESGEVEDGLRIYYCLAIVNKVKLVYEVDFANDLELWDSAMRNFCTPQVPDQHVALVREQAALLLLTFAQNEEYLRIYITKQEDLFWIASIDALRTKATGRTSILLLLRAVFSPSLLQTCSTPSLTQYLSTTQRVDLLASLLAIYEALPQTRNLDSIHAVQALGPFIRQSAQTAQVAIERGLVGVLMQQIKLVITVKELEQDIAFDMAWSFVFLTRNLLAAEPKVATELIQCGILSHLYSVYIGLDCDSQRVLTASVPPILCDIARCSSYVALVTQKVGKDSWFETLTSAQIWNHAAETGLQFLSAFTQTGEGRKLVIKSKICALDPNWILSSAKKSRNLSVTIAYKLQLLANIIATPEAISLATQIPEYVDTLKDFITSPWAATASPALAVVCNMHFQTAFKSRLIMTGTVPFLCRQIIQGVWDDVQKSHMVSALWAVAANGHKAKVLVRQHLDVWLSLNFPDQISHLRLFAAVEKLQQVLANE